MITAGFQQFVDFPSAYWIYKIGCDLGERLQDEAAVGKLGMRDREARFPHNFAPVKNEIDVECAGSFVCFALAVVLKFDREAAGKQLFRLKRGIRFDNGVEKPALV